MPVVARPGIVVRPRLLALPGVIVGLMSGPVRVDPSEPAACAVPALASEVGSSPDDDPWRCSGSPWALGTSPGPGAQSDTARHGRSDERRGRELARQRTGAGSGREFGHALGNAVARTRPGRDSHQETDRRDGRRSQPYRVPRSVQQRTHRAATDAKRERNLVVRPALELAQHDRVALALGKAVYGGEHFIEPLPPFEHLIGTFGSRVLGVKRLVLRRAVAKGVQGSVVGDPVQPGPQL